MSAKILDRTNSHLWARFRESGTSVSKKERGIVNGNGLVNGGITARAGLSNGLVNGTGFNGSASKRNRKLDALRVIRFSGIRGLGRVIGGALAGIPGFLRESISKKAVVSIIIALLVILPAGYFSLPSGPSSRSIQVDGYISDWNGVQRQSLFGTHGSLTASALTLDSNNIYFYLNCMPSDNETVLYGFIDADGNPNTGYSYGGIGADYLVSIRFTSQGISSRTASMYGSNTNLTNWTSWSTVGSVVAAMHMDDNGVNLEVKVPSYLVGNNLSDRFRVVWQDRAVIFQQE